MSTSHAASTAESGPGPIASPRSRAFWSRLDPVLLVPALLTLVIGAWDLTTPSYWRDEAGTIDALARPVPALLRMLTNVDAVHGAYYLLMWPIVRGMYGVYYLLRWPTVHTFAIAEVVLRLPSLLAMTAAAAGVAALGRRLHSARAGLLAGLVFAVLPQVSRYAQEGRSYALVLACAVLASYLLVRAVAEPNRRRFAGYGCAIAVLGLLNMFGLLLLAGHAAFVVARHRALLRRWLTVAALACVPTVPVAVLAWRERDQFTFLAGSDAGAPGGLIVWLAGSTGAVVLVSVLIGLGLRSRNGAATAWLSLPWLVAPPVLLLSATALAIPVYDQRYVAYCLPALALPVGVGLAGITLAPRTIALLLIAALGLPTQIAQRQPDGHGDDIRAAADIIAAQERPGDGVLYDCPTCHYPDVPREFAFAYPGAFDPLVDLSLAQSPSASGTLRGTETDPATLARRLGGVDRVWLVELNGHSEPAPPAGSGLHLAAVYPAADITVALFQR